MVSENLPQPGNQPHCSVQCEDCRSPLASVHSTTKLIPSHAAPERNAILNVTALSPGMLSHAVLLKICASSDIEFKITCCATVSWATFARMKTPRSSFFGRITQRAGGRGTSTGFFIRSAVVIRRVITYLRALHTPRPSTFRTRSSDRQKTALSRRARTTAIHPAGSRRKLAMSHSVMHRTLPKGRKQ